MMWRSKWLWFTILLALLPAVALMVYRSFQSFEVQFLEAGVPVENAKLDYFDDKGGKHKSLTNVEGKAKFPNAPRKGCLVVQLGEGFEQPNTLTFRPKGFMTIDFLTDRTVFTTRTLFSTRTGTHYLTREESADDLLENRDLYGEPESIKIIVQ